MSSFTAATVEGFVTQPPVFKKTKTGKSLCTFSLAIRHYSQPDEDPYQCECGLKTGLLIGPLADEHPKDQRGCEEPPRAKQ